MPGEFTFNSNTVISVLNALFTVLSVIYLAGWRVARMEVKVDTMWMFQLRRGLVEIETKGLGAVNSPLKLSEKANEAIKPLVPRLQELYQQIHGPSLTIVELAVEIEKHFGPELSEVVCRVIDISDGACLVLAIGQLRPILPVRDLTPRLDIKGGGAIRRCL